MLERDAFKFRFHFYNTVGIVGPSMVLIATDNAYLMAW